MTEKSRKTEHMGMEMTEEEHERWHQEPWEMSPGEHDALIRKMGITEDQDREWHEKHGVPQPVPSDRDRKSVNPFAIGGGFLDYCVTQGWLVREGKGRSARYYVTRKGEEELPKFGIKI